MTYNVLMGTLNPTHSLAHQFVPLIQERSYFKENLIFSANHSPDASNLFLAQRPDVKIKV